MSTTVSPDHNFEIGIERAIKRYYSHRPADIDEAKAAIKSAIAAGKVSISHSAYDIVNVCLFGVEDDSYLTVRALALEILRNPQRFGTTSTGEGFAAALLFGRRDWLGSATWAYAAKRVGPEWLNAICKVEDDFKWLQPPIDLKETQEASPLKRSAEEAARPVPGRI
jgi:hypothetical protein